MTDNQVVIAWEYTTARGEKRFGHGIPTTQCNAQHDSESLKGHPHVKHSILTLPQLEEWKRGESLVPN